MSKSIQMKAFLLAKGFIPRKSKQEVKFRKGNQYFVFYENGIELGYLCPRYASEAKKMGYELHPSIVHHKKYISKNCLFVLN